MAYSTHTTTVISGHLPGYEAARAAAPLTAVQKARLDEYLDKMFGTPSAAKRGRNPGFPYVPLADFGEQRIGRNRTRTAQFLGRAFATREEAVSHAAQRIDGQKRAFMQALFEPRQRALREQIARVLGFDGEG